MSLRAEFEKTELYSVEELRWLDTVLAVCEYVSFAKSWQEKGETWKVKNMLMKDFD